jgi:hypothetical protein
LLSGVKAATSDIIKRVNNLKRKARKNYSKKNPLRKAYPRRSF